MGDAGYMLPLPRKYIATALEPIIKLRRFKVF
jgi:hypothetical protein